ncbi:MAG TPA: hypothetical protein VM818_24075 [Vicinamibacterales bacterium]|jgi:hypothetical protein|nr:hypothetical protein [Vicinamibacterales bacterium]
MPRNRSFDEITYEIEHVHPVHPLRTLIKNHFYLDSWVSSEGGLSLAMFNALLFVPFMMALFFYPIQALIGLGAVVAVLLVVYESVVLWRFLRRRRAPRT